ncbi:hypothetical protein TWF751_009123 [Orbilia oligospora]|nr:hypothetical protein TWF751_009123 [Orbilia oligospora]
MALAPPTLSCLSDIDMAPRESRYAVPLRISAASNGLQFSHHFNSSYGGRYQSPRLLSTQYYSDAPAGPRFDGRPAKKQQTAVLTPVDPNKGAARPTVPVLRRTVSSLVPPDVPLKPLAKSKAKNEATSKLRTTGKSMAAAMKAAHRLSSSGASIHSTTSSFRSRKRKYYQVACLTSMPCEILDEIFCHLDQKTLHAILLSNKYLADSAAPALYAAPTFASTYRFAQFVSLITHNAPLANLVRELDLSNIPSEVPEDMPLAGWRDWKYRTDPLHTIRREDNFRLRKGVKVVAPPTPPKGVHPLPSPFLTQYHTCRDVPFGALLHIIVACQRLRKVDISNVPIADDYAVLSPAARYSKYRPTAFTNLLFVSDVPKAYTWRPDETKAINAAVDVVDAVLKLKNLEYFGARHGVWVTSAIANKLVTGYPKIEWDFRDCGGYKGEKWATEGTSEEIYSLLNTTE